MSAVGRVLHLQVQVPLLGVARVADLADDLPAMHPVADLHSQASLLQMPVEHVVAPPMSR